MEECLRCGFYVGHYGCTCYDFNMWYACPIENKKPENIQELKEYAEWMPQYEGKWVEKEAKDAESKEAEDGTN